MAQPPVRSGLTSRASHEPPASVRFSASYANVVRFESAFTTAVRLFTESYTNVVLFPSGSCCSVWRDAAS